MCHLDYIYGVWWDDAFISGDAFDKFLKDEQTRVNDVLKSVGLVKS